METAWLIGSPTQDDEWSLEGIFNTEIEAVIHCHNSEFIMGIKCGARFPENVNDSQVIKLYYPHDETWEESGLYILRNGLNLKV